MIKKIKNKMLKLIVDNNNWPKLLLKWMNFNKNIQYKKYLIPHPFFIGIF